MRVAPALFALVLGGLAAEARAGETRCWLDNGVVVVPAALGDIAGDFILDLSAPQSQLHQDVAQAHGIGTPSADGTLRLAGETETASLAVADLDARGWGFPTGIAGVIGEDVLGGYVVELRFAPCRLTLLPRAPSPSGATQPVRQIAGLPAVEATISDGRRARRGWMAIDTGSAGVRVADTEAALSVVRKGLDPDDRNNPPAHLAGLETADALLTHVPASLETQTPSGLLGSLGDVVWTRYAWIRLDTRAGKLELGPAR